MCPQRLGFTDTLVGEGQVKTVSITHFPVQLQPPSHGSQRSYLHVINKQQPNGVGGVGGSLLSNTPDSPGCPGKCVPLSSRAVEWTCTHLEISRSGSAGIGLPSSELASQPIKQLPWIYGTGQLTGLRAIIGSLENAFSWRMKLAFPSSWEQKEWAGNSTCARGAPVLPSYRLVYKISDRREVMAWHERHWDKACLLCCRVIQLGKTLQLHKTQFAYTWYEENHLHRTLHDK